MQEKESIMVLRCEFEISVNHLKIEPAHKFMALFILRKLILQKRMCSHPVGLDV